MRINMDQVIKNLNGEALQTDGKDMTLGIACAIALSTPVEDDKKMSSDIAIKRWKLAVQVHGGGEIDISPEDISELRQRLPKVLAVIVAGQCCDMLG